MRWNSAMSTPSGKRPWRPRARSPRPNCWKPRFCAWTRAETSMRSSPTCSPVGRRRPQTSTPPECCAAERRGRWPGCPSCSKISVRRWRAPRKRWVRAPCALTWPPRRRGSWNGIWTPAWWCSVRRTPRSGATTAPPNPRCSDRRSTRGRRTSPPVVPAAGPRRRWPPASWRPPRAVTEPARSECRHPAAGWSGSNPAAAERRSPPAPGTGWKGWSTNMR